MAPITNKPPRRLDVNVSGGKGANATDGVSGSRGWSNARGSDGSDATTAKPGERGADIDVLVKVARAEGDAFETSASVRTSDSPNAKEEFLPAGSDIFLTSRGGIGGHGGVGGDGGDGGDGDDGDDATESSSGENGEDGGNGGDAGRGTSGARGGDGGRVRVRAAAADTDALAAVRADVAGGDGGNVGRHGTAGRGGSGGDGGDSHSWNEDDGKGGSTPRYNSGGNDGRDGLPGSVPYETLSAGERGKDGSVVYEVVGADGGVQQFNDRYRMQTTGVKVRDSNNDGIFEPGESASIDLGFKNVGPMTSPSAPVKAHASGDWLTQVSPQTLHPSIASGESTDVKNVAFRVKPDDTRHVGSGLSSTTAIQTEAVAERVGVSLSESKHQTNFTVQHPVRISAMTGDRTATRTRPAKVSWEIENVSAKPLGNQSESQRVIQSMLQVTGGDVAAEHLFFVAPDGKRSSVTQALSSAIANLAPGQKVKLDGELAFSDAAPFHSQVTLSAMLDVGALDEPSKAKGIQAREFSIQLARTYAKDPDAGLLLVTNNRTTKEEVAAWEQLAQELGTKVNVWNLSLYGGASLTRAMGDADLGKDFAKKTVVMLNNDFDPEQGGVPSPVGHLGERDFLLSSVRNRTSAYVVGGNVDVKAQLFAAAPESSKTFESADALTDAVEAHTAGTDEALGADVVSVEARGAPSKEKLNEAAAELKARLEAEHPERRFGVSVNYEPKKDDSWFGFAKKQSLGTVTVSRGADVDQNVLVHQQAADVHSMDFVKGAQNRYALAKSFSLPLKLAALERLTEKAGDAKAAESVSTLAKALLADLAEEQQALRTQDFNGEVSKEELAEKLGDLRDVAAFFRQVQPNSPRGALVLDLAAELRQMTEQAKTLSDKMLPGRRRNTLDAVSDELVEQLVRNAFGSTTAPSIQKALETRAEALEKRDAKASEDDRLGMTRYLQPDGLWSKAVTTDFDVSRAKA